MCVLWVGLATRMLPGSREHDFLSFYTGAELARDGRLSDLYDPATQLEHQRRIVPQLPALVPFIRPLFYALVLTPLALLPYNAAFVVWIGAQAVLLLACWTWGWRRFGADALVFAALFLPGPLGIAAGQDCALLFAILILALEMSERGKPLASGAALALMLVKFNLILLWPLALLVSRRWRMLAGFCAAAAVEIAICLIAGGIRGVESYVALLRNPSLEALSPSPELMVGYRGLLTNLEIHSAWPVAAIVASVVAVLVFAVWNAPDWRLFALAPVASLIVAPHVYAYDAALLLVPVWLTIFKSAHKAPRIAAALFATPIPFGFALAGAPWAIVSSASLMAFFLILSAEF